jgi:hypothetical protein
MLKYILDDLKICQLVVVASSLFKYNEIGLIQRGDFV